MRDTTLLALGLALTITTPAFAGGSNYGITPGARPALGGKISEWPVPTPKFGFGDHGAGASSHCVAPPEGRTCRA